MNRTAALAALLSMTQTATAIEAWMDETSMRAAFGGKTIQGHYASGKAFTEIYLADGGIE